MARGGLKRFAGALDSEVSSAIFAAGDVVKVEAQTSITNGAQSGRNHVPSVAPLPPNNDTGVLADNIEAVQTTPFTVEVSSNAPYSAYLEYGSSRMPARPFMGPALLLSRPKVEKLIAAAVTRAAKKAES